MVLRCRSNPSTCHSTFTYSFFADTPLLPFPCSKTQKKDLLLCNYRLQHLSRLSLVDDARRLFDEMPQRDAVTWNTLITAYFQSRRTDDARALFDTFQGKNVRTWTAVITGYAKNGRIGEARLLFEEMPERNIISWNAMVSGYAQNGDVDAARRLFEEMTERNVTSWNSMLTGYCHCHRMEEARSLFDGMPERNLVSWTVMISGYVQVGNHGEAWITFKKSWQDGLVLDQLNFVAILSTVTWLKDLKLVEYLQSLAIKTSFDRDVVLGTVILNANTRNGELSHVVRFFEGMPKRNEYSWTSMIALFRRVANWMMPLLFMNGS